ncbi:MAG: tetratricopeptide repeat protein [Deltaproteobacteria bacterium]|nr:tetratricopeptide repeat protein [Deltaproteobacteria bacterium]
MSSLQEAAGNEETDEWVEALRGYQIALTVCPDKREAVEGLRRTEEKLRGLAEEQYTMGRSFEKEGEFSTARRHFLKALRLWPDHKGALERLTSRKRQPVQEAYLIHKIQPGESLSKLAMIYYGDPAKFPVIAGYNQIQDADFVRIGQEVKVPSPGGRITERPAQKKVEVEEEEKDIPVGYRDWALTDREHEERHVLTKMDKAEEAYQIAGYRELGAELLREGRYQEALFEFNKVLSVYPDDQPALDYACTAFFELGLSSFQKQDYQAAREYFTASLRHRSDCRQSRAFLEETEELCKEMYYKKGIEHYGKEQLSEAIKAWETVRSLDPHYKRVEYYIGKAKEIQEKLEELKQETRQGLSE